LQKCNAFLFQTIQLSGITCLWKWRWNGCNAVLASVSSVLGDLRVPGDDEKLPLCGIERQMPDAGYQVPVKSAG
jgi:hypothetical protein